MIRFENVTKIFHDTQTVALQQVSFHIEPGQLCILTGDSGAGKTTLMRLLLRELEPDGGNIWVNGRELRGIRRREVPMYRRKLGMVFQDYRLIPDRSIYQNVAMPKLVAGAKEKDIRNYVLMALRTVGLEDRFDCFPNELSGGEQQRVGIARAIVGNPHFLMADEPTGNLDPDSALEIMQLLERINKMLRTTILIATHDMDAVRELSCRRLHLEDGRIWQEENRES